MDDHNLQVRLIRRPVGLVQQADFALVECPLPVLPEGQVLLKHRYLSLDPYMRGRMNAARSYAPSVGIGEIMTGDTVADIVESKSPEYKVAETVVARGAGWQRYSVTDGTNLRRVDPKLLPASAYLGVAGMPGVTAWVGLLEIGRPKAGETVVVSAATGAVGSVVGQLARIKGCRAVGIAGSDAKCDYARHELGFDACINYHSANVAETLRQAAPDGIDVHFENVGGPVFDIALEQCNPFARIALCGMIADYNVEARYGVRNLLLAVGKRIKIQGFIVHDHSAAWLEAVTQLGEWVRNGDITYRETVILGLERAPEAFIGLFRGDNLGKLVVKIF